MGSEMQKNNEFEVISGRLALMANQTKYTITTDEVKRRVEGPESMNSSTVAGLLKRSKLKHGGEEMRTKLRQHGIQLDLCRRKAAPTSSVTAICEGEMMTIASDLDKIVKESYPTKIIAKKIVASEKTAEKQNELFDDAEGFLTLMPILMKVMNSSQPPLSGVAQRSSGNSKLDEAMALFSSHTHGMGPLNQRTWGEQMMKIGQEVVKMKPDQQLPKKSKNNQKRK